MTTTAPTTRPSWAQVALASDLDKLATQYAAESRLWHDDKRSLYVARSAGNLRLLAEIIRGSVAWIATGSAFVTAAELQLVQLRKLRANVAINQPVEALEADWVDELQAAWMERGRPAEVEADQYHVCGVTAGLCAWCQR